MRNSERGERSTRFTRANKFVIHVSCAMCNVVMEHYVCEAIQWIGIGLSLRHQHCHQLWYVRVNDQWYCGIFAVVIMFDNRTEICWTNVDNKIDWDKYQIPNIYIGQCHRRQFGQPDKENTHTENVDRRNRWRWCNATVVWVCSSRLRLAPPVNQLYCVRAADVKFNANWCAPSPPFDLISSWYRIILSRCRSNAHLCAMCRCRTYFK